MKKARIHLGLVHTNEGDDYWQMRVQPESGPSTIVRVKMTPEQFSAFMAGQMAEVELE